jgi:hypothetical protein
MVGLSAGSVAGRVTASIGGSRTVCIGRACGSLVRPLAHGDDRHIWSLNWENAVLILPRMVRRVRAPSGPHRPYAEYARFSRTNKSSVVDVFAPLSSAFSAG